MTLRPFIDWLEDENEGFYVRDTWDKATGEWVGPGKFVVFDIPRRVLQHAFTPDDNGNLPYMTVVYSTPKKQGKSILGAAVLAWALECYPPGTEVYTLANDLDQAEGIIFQDVSYHFERKFGIRSTKNKIVAPNGSFLQALSHHYRTAAGTRHSVTVWDELWAFNREASRRLWAEMTNIPTVKNPLRLIVTYAGFSDDTSPLRELYDRLVVDGTPVPELMDIQTSQGDYTCFTDPGSRSFAFWHTDPIMPWASREYYAEQAHTLRTEEFLRLHRNMWVSSRDMFIKPEWWEAASQRLQGPVTLFPTNPGRGRPFILAADAGLKHDTSAVVGCYYDPSTRHIGLAFHRIWTPQKGEVLDLEETLEAFILEMNARFNVIEVVYDPTQLQRSMLTLKKKGIMILELPPTGRNLVDITSALFEALKHGMVDAYPDDELKAHVIRAGVKKGVGGMQLKRQGSGGEDRHGDPIDAAVALGMAVWRTIQRAITLPEGDIVVENKVDELDPFEDWERGIMKKIPEALRPREFDTYYGEW